MKKPIEPRSTKDILLYQSKLIRLRRLCLRTDFVKFREYYFPHYHKVADGPFQEELSGLLFNMTQKRGSKIAIAAPRGSAKSTIVGLEFVIFCICYKLDQFIVIISATRDQAAGFLNDIKREFETNARLIQDFPDICEIGKPPRWKEDEIITRNNVRVLALGTGQQLRGRRNMQFRPSLIILDDIENDESAHNPEGYDRLEQWLTRSVLKSGSAETNVVFIGTIHHYNSLLAKATSPDSFPGWQKRIYKAVCSWPVYSGLWEEWCAIFNNRNAYQNTTGAKAALGFFENNKEKMLEGTKVLWPASRDYYELMVKREEEGYYSFDSEFQNEPVNPKDCYFNTEEIQYWDDRFDSEEALLNTLGERAQFYGACDPSMGKPGKNSDPSAIITLVRDSKSGMFYVLDASIALRKPDALIDEILAYAIRRRYLRFAFEINASQEFIKTELDRRSSERGIYLPTEGVNHTSDKIARIQSLQPFVNSGIIQFSRQHRQLLDQMRQFSRSRHDDGLDALEMVIQLCKEYSGGKPEISSTDRKDINSIHFEGWDPGDREFLEPPKDDRDGPSPNAKEIKFFT